MLGLSGSRYGMDIEIRFHVFESACACDSYFLSQNAAVTCYQSQIYDAAVRGYSHVNFNTCGLDDLFGLSGTLSKETFRLRAPCAVTTQTLNL